MQRFHELPLPQKVVIGECWARDGLQSEPVFVPTEQKVEMITRMVEAGFTEIEATSFAHPKYLPQFADAEEVLRRIPRRPGVRYRAICTTLKAVERAVKSKQEGFGVDEIAMVISSSEAHNRANVQMTREENKRLLEQMTRLALDTGHVVFGWALTAFGCPVSGDVPPAEAIGLGHFWRDVGAELIGFGDTVGVANPRQVSSFYEEVLAAGRATGSWSTSTTPAAGGSPTQWPRSPTASSTSTPRWARSAASPRRARLPITAGTRATPAPRTWCRCWRRWASLPASTCGACSPSASAPRR
jgi:hydroxymethylglutaryl-CoA lyase